MIVDIEISNTSEYLKDVNLDTSESPIGLKFITMIDRKLKVLEVDELEDRLLLKVKELM